MRTAAQKQDINSLMRFIYAGEHPATDVPLDLLMDACLEAGRLSPNSSNNQVWRFIVVREKKALEEAANACRANRPWRAAIAGAAEGGAMNSLLLDQPFWLIDLPIAFAHMSLAAASLQLPGQAAHGRHRRGGGQRDAGPAAQGTHRRRHRLLLKSSLRGT